jgi:hypothetical protein
MGQPVYQGAKSQNAEDYEEDDHFDFLSNGLASNCSGQWENTLNL